MSMMNPANPLSPLNPVSPISMWDDNEPVREVVRRGAETACSSGNCDSTIIAIGITFIVVVAIAIGFKIINS